MASWTNNVNVVGGGSKSPQPQLGFANFNNNSSFKSSGFGSNSHLFPKKKDFTTTPPENNPFSFGSGSKFGTNPTPPPLSPSGGGLLFGKPNMSSNSTNSGFRSSSDIFPKMNDFTIPPVNNNPFSFGCGSKFGTNPTPLPFSSPSGGQGLVFGKPNSCVFTPKETCWKTSSSSGVVQYSPFQPINPAPTPPVNNSGFSFGTKSLVPPQPQPQHKEEDTSYSFSNWNTTNPTQFPTPRNFLSGLPCYVLPSPPTWCKIEDDGFPSVSNPFDTRSKISSPPSTLTCMETSSTDEQGSRVKPYATTQEEGGVPNHKLLSISAMPFYSKTSYEELRLQDYQLCGKTVSDEIIVSISLNKDKSHEELRSDNYKLTAAKSGTESPFSFPRFEKTSTSTFPCSAPIPTNICDTTAPSVSTVTQATTSVPNLGNAFCPIINAPTTESIHVTSIPAQPVSTGVFIPSLWENKQQQQPTSPCTVSVEQSLVTNPFATEVRHTTLPATTMQYGISCLPVSDIAAKPAKGMPLVNARQLSLGRRRSPIEKYKPNTEEKKVPFYDEFSVIYKKNSGAFIPRENPRACLVLPNKQKMLEESLSDLSVSDHSTDICETGGTKIESLEVKKADVIAMIPKFTSPEYFMKPSTDDLIANELKTPGFCGQVKDFVIGRHKYGSIKLLGETDVRNLDLEPIVQFNNREVIVYMDEKAKPPVGKGLNKTAEISLLNIRCIDKNTGNQYTDGAKVDRYRECLVKKTMEQGAEFLSFDPVKGEWRFKVQHF